MGSLSDAIGVNQLWSFSPALDLQDSPFSVPSTNASSSASTGPLCAPPTAPSSDSPAESSWNALIACGGDCAHLLHTLARAARWPNKHIQLFLWEESPVATARHLLMLSIALDSTLSHQVRAELILELTGNVHIRSKTFAYLTQRVQQLTRFLTHDEGPLMALVDVSQLKFKERDEIEECMTAWLSPDAQVKGGDTDLAQLRDQRLRQYHGDRYDSRENMIDWDYYMTLKDTLSNVPFSVYKRWRMAGLAFEVRDCEYTTANPTLFTRRAAVMRSKGPVSVPGYWHDIAVSPFVSFGVESDNKELFEKRNNQHLKSAVEVSEYNIVSLLKEWEGASPHLFAPSDSPAVSLSSSLSSSNLRVIPLSGAWPTRLAAQLHRVHMGYGAATPQRLSAALNSLLSPQRPLITVDTLRYLPLKDEMRASYVDRVLALASAAGWQLVAADKPLTTEQDKAQAVRLAFTLKT